MNLDRHTVRRNCRWLIWLLAASFTAQAQNPDPAAPPPERVREIFLKAEQAREAGDAEQERELLEETIRLVGPASRHAFPVYERLRQNYGDRGLIARAVEVGEQQLKVAGGPAQAHHILTSLVTMNASLHRMERAKATLSRLEDTTNQLRASKRWAMRGAWWQAGLATAKATVAQRQGHLVEAEESLKACISSANASVRDNPDLEGSARSMECVRDLMDIQIRTGQLAAAGITADQLRVMADRTMEIKKRPAIHVRVKQSIGRLALEQGKTELARQIFSDGLASLQNSDSAEASLRAADLRFQLARVEMLLGHWPQALEWHRQREAALVGSGKARGRVFPGSIEYAYTLQRLGQTADALAMLESIVMRRRNTQDENSLFRWEADAFHGLALAANGQNDAALQALRRAIPRYLELANGERSSSEAGVMRTARLNWILDGYLTLLSDLAAGNGNDAVQARDEAFRLADLARGSTVQRALSISASRASIGDPALAALARREQDLQREIASLAESIGNLLARGRVAEQDTVVAEMRAVLARLRGDQTAILAEIEQRFPDYAGLLTPKPVSIAAVQKLLHPDEALISIYSGRERTLVWAVPARGEAHFAIVPLSSEQLDVKVATLRKALDPNAEAAGRLPKYDFDVAHELYAKLLTPVENGWREARELIVVPHGRLGQLPFGVLLTQPWKASAARLPYAEMAEAPWLIKRMAISQLPAVVALPALRTQDTVRRAQRPFIGFGDPVFIAATGDTRSPPTRGHTWRNLVTAGTHATPAMATPSSDLGKPVDFALLPQLPDTAQEIEEVASVLAADTERDVFLRRRASEALVKKTDLSSYRVVMFATHGLMGGELPGLYQPALALSNPEITGDGEDGMLTMEEILGLKLRADWVVLSACNTAAAGSQSSESVSGLGRAFFYAGARSLLVTHWAVETASARLLTTEAFRRQASDASLSRARALQQSSLTLMTQAAGNDYSYAHPMFWAPYTLVGDGGR